MDYLKLKSGTRGTHTARHMNLNGVWKEACRINQQSHAPQSAVTGRRTTTCSLISVWAVGEFFSVCHTLQ
jgi:hypothetical protein